jgi:tetratricopeptide (TPR) repeat protein
VTFERSIVTLLAVAALACGTEPASHAPEPPDPDTSAYEKQVAEKIRREREAVLADPGSAEAWGRLGMTFDAHRLTHEAAACYAEAERLDPGDWRWPYLNGVVSLDAPPESVLELFLRAHERAPDSAIVNLRIGRELLRLDRARDAEPYFRRAHQLDDGDPHALIGLARVALRFGEHDAARIHLEKAEDMRPRPREVHVLLAQVYQALGEDELAQRSAERAVRSTRDRPLRDPLEQEIAAHGVSSFQLAQRGREALRERDYGVAVEHLSAAVEANPDDPDVRADLGRALYLAGREDEARRAFEEANRTRPGTVDADRELESLRRRMTDE